MDSSTSTCKSFPRILATSVSIVLSKPIFTIPGIISYSFGINCMNNALKIMLVVFDVHESDRGLMEGVLQSSLYFGCILGSAFGLYILRISLRKILLVIDILIILGASMLQFSNLYVFLAGRVIMGIGCGMAPSMASYYLVQYCPLNLYGLIAGLNPLFFSIGQILCQSLGFLFQPTDDLIDVSQVKPYWKYYFTVLPISLCLIRIMLLQFVITDETPLHYVSCGDEIKAKKVLSSIYKDEFVEQMLCEVQEKSYQQASKPSILKRPYKRRFYFALFLQFLSQNNGYNAVTQFSTVIFHEVFDEHIAHGLTFMISIMKFVTYLFCISLTQKYGRRTLLLCGNFMMLMMNIIIGVLSITSDRESNQSLRDIQHYVAIVCIFIYLLSCYFSLTPLGTIYVPELVPSIGAQYSWVFFWFCATYILLGFPIVKQRIGISYCFFFFGVATLVGQVIFYYYAFETKGANERMIQEFYYPDKSRQKVNLLQGSDVRDSNISSSLITNLPKGSP